MISVFREMLPMPGVLLWAQCRLHTDGRNWLLPCLWPLVKFFPERVVSFKEDGMLPFLWRRYYLDILTVFLHWNSRWNSARDRIGSFVGTPNISTHFETFFEDDCLIFRLWYVRLCLNLARKVYLYILYGGQRFLGKFTYISWKHRS